MVIFCDDNNHQLVRKLIPTKSKKELIPFLYLPFSELELMKGYRALFCNAFDCLEIDCPFHSIRLI